MAIGAGVIEWKTKALWAESLLAVLIVLLAVAILAPRLYQPVEAGLDWVQEATLRLVTWTLLALVFALVFVPASLWLRITKGSRVLRSRKTDTYWRDCRPREADKFFGRQF